MQFREKTSYNFFALGAASHETVTTYDLGTFSACFFPVRPDKTLNTE